MSHYEPFVSGRCAKKWTPIPTYLQQLTRQAIVNLILYTSIKFHMQGADDGYKNSILSCFDTAEFFRSILEKKHRNSFAGVVIFFPLRLKCFSESGLPLLGSKVLF